MRRGSSFDERIFIIALGVAFLLSVIELVTALSGHPVFSRVFDGFVAYMQVMP